MKILAVEFSAPQRSVAVVQAVVGGAAVSAAARGGEQDGTSLPGAGSGEAAAGGTPALHSVEVIETGPGWIQALDLVDQALGEAKLEREQIEGLAVGLGPGSYTGIRAAIALAQGWQLARPVKLLGISSAEAIAAQAQAEGLRGKVDVVIDAQRNEFYLARGDIAEGGWRAVEPLRLATLEEVRECERAGELLIGPEATKWFSAGRIVFPRAATLGRLAAGRNDFISGEQLEPVYLRETTFVKAPPPRKLQ